MGIKIVVLAGDGIGPEVVKEAVRVPAVFGRFLLIRRDPIDKPSLRDVLACFVVPVSICFRRLRPFLAIVVERIF